VDREFERSYLEERYGSGAFELIVIYGRRRLGKTELIKNFLSGKPNLYFLCDRSGTESNARRFKGTLAEYIGEPPVESDDFREIFSRLVKKCVGRRLTVAIDEFSYMAEKDDAIPSVFQAIADDLLLDTDIFMILCGSSISMMEKGVLSHSSALYGRKTGHIRLGLLPFGAFHEFFPENDSAANVEFHAAVGGVPHYMRWFSGRMGVQENICREILERRGHLYEEVDFLLRSELREPDVYKGILSAIARGASKVVNLADKTGIRVQDMDKYLKVLMRLGLVGREVPVTEKRSKKSSYNIADSFVSTYFTFAEPFKSDLELGRMEGARSKLKEGFNGHVGRSFEHLVRTEVVPFVFKAERVGRWWGHVRDSGKADRRDIEIDVIALDERKRDILFGECKWTANVDGENLLRELRHKAGYVPWFEKVRNERYLVVAKSFKRRADEKDVVCLDLREIDRMLRKSMERAPS
jgi:hypothetical protein